MKSFIHQFETLVESQEGVSKRIRKIGEIAETIELSDNADLQRAMKTLGKESKDAVKYVNQMKARIHDVALNDLKQFASEWGFIKNRTLELFEATKTDKLKQTFSKKEMTDREKAKQIKDTYILEEKIRITIKDLRDPFEEFVHSQLYYHAKSLEVWSKVWKEFCTKTQKPQQKTTFQQVVSQFQKSVEQKSNAVQQAQPEQSKSPQEKNHQKDKQQIEELHDDDDTEEDDEEEEDSTSATYEE